VLGTLLPDPLYKVKGRINSPADPLGGTGGGVERQGHRELGKENITSVLGGLLDFLDWETAFSFNYFKVLPFGVSWLLAYPYKITHGCSNCPKGCTVWCEARGVLVALTWMNLSAAA